MSRPLIEARGLRMAFADRDRKPIFGAAPMIEVLKGIDFSIEKGESIGIVGESGSGKTTLGRALLRLDEPTGGSLHFDGIDYTHADRAAMQSLRPRMQMIFQDPLSSLNPRHRIGHIVAQPLKVAWRAISHAEIPAAALRALDRVGLVSTFARRYPHELSGGQRQRVGIARAIVLEPDFILADEIVSGLDVSTQAQILTLLKDLKRDMGLSLAFISHDLSVVRVLCDRVVVMLQGEIVERGECEAVFAAPRNPYTRQLIDAVPLPDIDKSWLDRDVVVNRNRELAMNIEGKVVLVTGANRGIGAAYVAELVARGAAKVYAGVREPGSLAGVAGSVEEVKLDVTSEADVAAAVSHCQDVNLLINNAGLNFNDHLIATRDDSNARTEMDVNYFGTLSMCRAFAPVIEKNGGGGIINMSSITGRAPIPLMGSAAATKAAIYSMTQSIRAELTPKGIHVMAVLPGAVDTRMTENFPGDKAVPADIVAAVLDGLGNGEGDLYPDGMAQGISGGLIAAREDTLADLAQYV